MTATTKKIIPSDSGALLLLADDCRQEPGGKMTLLGYMPGTEFDVGPLAPGASPDAAQILQSLTLIVVFTDGAGEFLLKVSLIDANGQERFPGVAPQKIRKEINGPMNVILALKPFPVTMGDYTLTVWLDESRYNRKFTMRRSPA